jgi:hypothetical protein
LGAPLQRRGSGRPAGPPRRARPLSAASRRAGDRGCRVGAAGARTSPDGVMRWRRWTWPGVSPSGSGWCVAERTVGSGAASSRVPSFGDTAPAIPGTTRRRKHLSGRLPALVEAVVPPEPRASRSSSVAGRGRIGQQGTLTRVWAERGSRHRRRRTADTVGPTSSAPSARRAAQARVWCCPTRMRRP